MSEDNRTARLENRNYRQIEESISDLETRLVDQLDLVEATIQNHSTTLDTLTSRMSNSEGGRHRGANIPLTPFSGDRSEDLTQYLKRFELICTANNYAPEGKAEILGSNLKGKAWHIYQALTPAQQADYEELKNALIQKFNTTDYLRYANQKFQERKQLISETVSAYGCDLHRLGLAALSNIDAEQRDSLIREKFIAGLLPEMRELILYSNQKTFDEAMTLAERLEGLQPQKRDVSARSVMLLEGINDRLAHLELQSTRRNVGASARQEERGRPSTNFVNRSSMGINLNNFRNEFRPNGVV